MYWLLPALAALALLHFWWRGKFRRARQEAEERLAAQARDHERARQEAQAEQEAFLDSMVEGLLVLDQGGRVRLANRAFAALFELSSDARGKTLLEAVRLHELAGLVASLGEQKPVLGYELKLPGPRERWFEINATALFDAAGKRQGTVLVFHDLTRLKKLERTREEFVANVSHELRTPLSLIKGYAETLIDGAKDEPTVAASFLEKIDRNAERLKLLIEDLLAISELESGRIKLELQSVSAREVADKVLVDLKARATGKQVELRQDLPDFRVSADPRRLEQIFTNLVDNAIKYGGSGKVVVIGGREAEAGLAELWVRDQGPGIPAEALERIFERFYRVDKARSRDQGGTGLGLSIVKHLVQNQGGKVWAKSEPGRGATFYFTLPKASAGQQQPLL